MSEVGVNSLGDEEVVKAAFGSKNRNRLIDRYFSTHTVGSLVAGSAWEHVYRLLLWVDPTTGLAHCYESDKCQPGKNWYARSLAFHDWLSQELGAEPSELHKVIDWLFIHATKDLANEVVKRAARVAAIAEKQMAPYLGRSFPNPGEDRELIELVRGALGRYLDSEPSERAWRDLTERARQYFSLQNKRKNLVGEGFEDVLAKVIGKVCSGSKLKIRARCPLHDIEGFNRTRAGEKPNKVDVAIEGSGLRTLVTAKWSVRADREKQFTSDFNEYLQAESKNEPFEYVFVTNEFDPARLVRACDKMIGNGFMFSQVVHINPAAIQATYGARPEATMKRVLGHIDSGRMKSLGSWLGLVAS